MSNYCLSGRILKVDLSDRCVQILKTPEFEGGFWGGRGLNQSLLLDLQGDVASPFDARDIIAFGPGRLVGTGAPCAVRMNIDSKNVFTGGIGSSNIGGKFPSELKSAGFDHILVSGKSENPVYLWVSDDEAEIRDGKALRGRLLSETGTILKSLIGDEKIQFIAIGPAGENKVWTSAILDGNARAAARCGLGAIMGSKKLKAIVVQCTHRGRTKTSNPDQFSALIEKWAEKLSSLPSVKRKSHLGTVAAIPPLNKSAAIPVRNFEDEYLSEDELSHYLPERFDRMARGTILSCTPCSINCQHSYRSSPPDQMPYDKLEANTVLDFGPRLGLTSPEDILTCHALCSQYGLDIDSTASVICWAMDCFEKGVLTTVDTDGLFLQWGDPDTIFQLIKKIALREGVGELLAEGSHRASKKLGRNSERLSFTIKGQDLIEPLRSCKGWALGIGVSPRGGTHTRGAPQTEFHRVDRETGKGIWDVETAGIPQEYEGKAKLVVYYERLHAVLDSLGLCYFVSNWSSPDLLGPREIADLCCSALGEDVSEESLMNKGERILTLEKIYNMVHTDFGREDDYPSDRFFDEPIQSGPFAGEKLDRKKWGEMLTEYYLLHGWDPRTSYPALEKLKQLDLEKYIGLVQGKGKIL